MPQTNEAVALALAQEGEQLSHGEYLLVRDGNLAFEFKPAALGLHGDVPRLCLRLVNAQRFAFGPFNVEGRVFPTGYFKDIEEVNQRQIGFGLAG